MDGGCCALPIPRPYWSLAPRPPVTMDSNASRRTWCVIWNNRDCRHRTSPASIRDTRQFQFVHYRSNQSLADDVTSPGTLHLREAEEKMRRALGLSGQSAPQQHRAIPDMHRPKRRFVADGEVPVTVLPG